MDKNQQWLANNAVNLTGKTVIVTGANSGLGYETTKNLVSWGASVIMACRDTDKAEQAKNKIAEALSEQLTRHGSDTLANTIAAKDRGEIHIEELDLASLSSIKRFAESFKQKHTALDILCNNAGVMALPLCRTAEGFEMQIGTNHLGHFALTSHLLPLIIATPNARVMNVSSGFHTIGHIRLDDLNWHKRYSKWLAYSQSKLANLLFTYELQRRFERHNIDALSVAAHPGYAATQLALHAPAMQNSSMGVWLSRVGTRLTAQPATAGALPSTLAATGAEVCGGDYYGPKGILELRGRPEKVSAIQRAHDLEVASKLWDLSESLTKTPFDFTATEQKSA
ncbi:MAG: short-chain dehydrogenase [Gammaproteobacteria bacterium]|nr:MAG: short-chain dehydrogenase [Gammaproteobacteria bacterium]